MEMIPKGSHGTGWEITGSGSLRNRYGHDPTVMNVYYRYESAGEWSPPYEWSGEIRTRQMMDPPVFMDGTPCWYTPALVFHPMYGSSTTPAAPNNENVLIGVGSYQSESKVGVSAELRDERPDRPYGVRTGYVSRERGAGPDPFWDGRWHSFKVVVRSHAEYELWWDGELMARVVEQEPATMAGLNHVGLRCDFTDIEIRNFNVTPLPIKDDDMEYLAEHRRLADTRKKGGALSAGETRRFDLGTGINVAAINVTCQSSAGKDGYLSIGGTPAASPGTSSVNYDHDRVANASLVGAFPDGGVYVKAHGSSAHVIVDLQAYGT